MEMARAMRGMTPEEIASRYGQGLENVYAPDPEEKPLDIRTEPRYNKNRK